MVNCIPCCKTELAKLWAIELCEWHPAEDMWSRILIWWNLPSTKGVWLNRHITLSLHLFHFLEQIYIQTWNVTETSIYELKCHQSQNSQATENKIKTTLSPVEELQDISSWKFSFLALKTFTRWVFSPVTTAIQNGTRSYRLQIWDNDFMKKNMRFSYWFGGIAFRTDKHRGHFEWGKRLKIKYSTNSNKYTSTSAYNDILGAITK